MRDRLPSIAVIAVFCAVSVAWAAPPQRTHDITVDDYLTVHLIPDCTTSADGRHVAFTELRWGEHDEPRSTDLWVAGTESPRPLRLTLEPGGVAGQGYRGNLK